jgi:glycine cleavage system H protein
VNEADLKYSKGHLWLAIEGAEARLGVTDHAQKEMGDVVFLELEETGKSFGKGDIIGNIESVKAASDIEAPLAGEIVAVNDGLTDQPSVLNSDPLGEGWIYRIKIADPSEAESLMDLDTYKEFLTTQ